MTDNYSFAFLSQSMSVLLTAVTVFAVKGVVVLVYASSTNVPHVYTMEIAMMWSLLICTLLCFSFIVVGLIAGTSVYMMIQNLHAYLAVMLGLFLYSIFVLVECTDATSLQCKYLYPVSSTRMVEAGINVGLMFVHVITSLGFVMTIKGSRELLPRSLAAGGGFYAVVTCILLSLVQAHGMASSCRGTVDFATYTSLGGIETFLLVAGLGAIVYVGPVAFYAIAAEKRITLTNIYDTEESSGEIKTIEAGVPSIVRIAMAASVIAYALLLLLLFGDKVLAIANIWICLTILGLSTISLAVSFWRVKRDTGANQMPMQTARRSTWVPQRYEQPQTSTSLQNQYYSQQQQGVGDLNVFNTRNMEGMSAKSRSYWKNV
eukprot:2356614-Rhodomonas_salina.11